MHVDHLLQALSESIMENEMEVIYTTGNVLVNSETLIGLKDETQAHWWALSCPPDKDRILPAEIFFFFN